MKLRWMIGFCLLAACSNNRTFNDRYYAKEKAEVWSDYTKEMNMPLENLNKKILIIANSTACAPCINEIQYWDLVRDELDTDVVLVLVEKYESSYRSFLSRLHVQMPAFQDSTALIFEKELIPASPVKIYFNTQGETAMIYPVGAGGEREKFLYQIKKVNPVRHTRRYSGH